MRGLGHFGTKQKCKQSIVGSPDLQRSLVVAKVVLPGVRIKNALRLMNSVEGRKSLHIKDVPCILIV